MLVKTCELTGRGLDWAVAQCERVEPGRSSGKPYLPEHRVYLEDFIPSYSWCHGGPIIEREWICNDRLMDGRWLAVKRTATGDAWMYSQPGPTPLIAACRCFVASRLGDTVDIPEELHHGH